MAETTTRPNLLLVEDDADTLEVLSILLGERYAVSAYRSPLDALRELGTARPDLLILDIGMHPINGVECLQKIRATPGNADVPAMALTGYARDDERARFLARGFQAVVVKPILDSEDLMAVIDGLVDRSAASGCDAVPDLDAQARMPKFIARGASQTGRGRLA
ncbi:MAG TPA: response regulator [Candidatus Binatia bacterium]|nr:response regulator [Candidatus Binatia bacterium]